MRSAIVRNSNLLSERIRGCRAVSQQLRTRTSMGPSAVFVNSTTRKNPCVHYQISRWKSTVRETDPHTTATTTATTTSSLPRVQRTPVVPFPLSPPKTVPSHIPYPPYVTSGQVKEPGHSILLHDVESIPRMRAAAQVARHGLDLACGLAVRAHWVGRTTDDIDTAVHDYMIRVGAYPSPLGYCGFPKSICSSINEVICHGIPDQRPLQFGDVVSFDVSCFLNGVHGDNCATVIVGDCPEDYNNNDTNDPYFVAARLSRNDDIVNTHIDHCDWRGIPYRTEFATPECEAHFVQARRLVQSARDCLYHSIATVRAGSCLTEIGRACDQVASHQHGYQSVRKYRGHGIGSEFHIPPFVKHYTNVDFCQLRPGMIFTIEPMIVAGNEACYEWTHDDWTAATVDGSLAAQFEHTIRVTDDGAEILTLP